MRIGYIISSNKIKDKLRPWMKLEIQELCKRGYEVVTYRDTNAIQKGDVDFIVAHYLNIGQRVDSIGIPYITISHGSRYDTNIPKAIELTESKNCKYIGLDSIYNYEAFREIPNPDKIRYFPQPARTEFFTRTKPLGDRIIGGGRLKPQKGFHLAVEACPKMTLFGGELTADTSYINKLQSISKDIILTGWIFDTKLKELYEDSWLYLHPSLIVGDKIEGPSNVFKEALLMELQVISTDIGGISELKYINFVEPTVEAIKESIEKTPKVNNIAGRDFIREHYNPKLCVDILEKAIND